MAGHYYMSNQFLVDQRNRIPQVQGTKATQAPAIKAPEPKHPTRSRTQNIQRSVHIDGLSSRHGSLDSATSAAICESISSEASTRQQHEDFVTPSAVYDAIAVPKPPPDEYQASGSGRRVVTPVDSVIMESKQAIVGELSKLPSAEDMSSAVEIPMGSSKETRKSSDQTHNNNISRRRSSSVESGGSDRSNLHKVVKLRNKQRVIVFTDDFPDGINRGALLDTGCERSNWVDEQVVKKLKAKRTDHSNLHTETFDGHKIRAFRRTTLSFYFKDDSTKTYEAEFWIQEDLPGADLILGDEFIANSQIDLSGLAHLNIRPLKITRRSTERKKKDEEATEKQREIRKQERQANEADRQQEKLQEEGKVSVANPQEPKKVT